MWALQRFFIALGVIAVFNGVSARAQQAAVDGGQSSASIAWKHDLDLAKKEAAATGKLVLVHFAANWCGPCHQFDADVLSRPEVTIAINDNYVAVRLDADQNPGIARSMGITRLPTDVILNATGQEVARFATNEQRREVANARSFVGEITRIAAASRPTPSATLAQRNVVPSHQAASVPGARADAVPGARADAVPGAQAAEAPGVQVGAPQTQSEPPPADHPYTALGQPHGGPQAQATPDNTPYASLQHNVPNAADGAPHHDIQTNAASHLTNTGNNGANTYGNPVTTGSVTPQTTSRYSSGGAQPVSEPRYGMRNVSASDGADAGHIAARNSAQNTTQNVLQNVSQDAVQNAGDISVQNATVDAIRQAPSAADRRMPDATQHMAAGNVPPMSHSAADSQASTADFQNQQSPTAMPANTPPLALEGYCPVTLKTESRWVAGDRRWGAIHQGRTYLFVGPQQQQQFLANPNEYSPVLSGTDAVLALDAGQQVDGHRRHGVVYDNRVFLFANETSLQRFIQNPERYAQGVRQAQRVAADRTAPR